MLFGCQSDTNAIPHGSVEEGSDLVVRQVVFALAEAWVNSILCKPGSEESTHQLSQSSTSTSPMSTHLSQGQAHFLNDPQPARPESARTSRCLRGS